MITNYPREAPDCSTNSPCQHISECIESSKEKMHPDVSVWKGKPSSLSPTNKKAMKLKAKSSALDWIWRGTVFLPGQLFTLCFSSEHKITGFLLVTHQYRRKIIVKLQENNNRISENLNFTQTINCYRPSPLFLLVDYQLTPCKCHKLSPGPSAQFPVQRLPVQTAFLSQTYH